MLQGILIRDISLNLFRNWVSPSLCIGVTFADFHGFAAKKLCRSVLDIIAVPSTSMRISDVRIYSGAGNSPFGNPQISLATLPIVVTSM